MVLTVYNAIILAALLYLVFNTVLNYFIIKDISKYSFKGKQTLISILIPARDEEGHIAKTINSLRKQSYKNIEIIIFDDDSNDKTASIVEGILKKDKRIKLLNGKSVPEGWTGKNFACDQLSKHAGGNYLFFADADTYYKENAISSAIGCLKANNLDALSAKPKHLLKEFYQKLAGSLVYFGIFGLMPLFFMKLKKPKSVNASGSFFLIKRAVYKDIGGYKSIKDKHLDDINLARSVLKGKYDFMLFNGAAIFRTRLFDNIKGVYDGFSRLFITFSNNNRLYLSFLLLAVAILFLFPFVFAVAIPFLDIGFNEIIINANLVGFQILAIIISRLIISLKTKNKIIDIFLHPISVAFLIFMYFKLLIKGKKSFKIKWKGRIYGLEYPQ